ncbi:MAG: LysE family transporter [Planctomycetes bacterium]|nr:LysE family transporter [Planctomycetota bacterium]
MKLLLFLVGVVGISLSGVMAPGPVTATTIVMGSRNRFAGVLIAVGHGIVEFPLIVLIVVGMNKVLENPAVKMVIGFAGGVFLLVMAVQILRSLRSLEQEQAKTIKGAPIMAGIVLTAGNPYFLMWWATIGLGLATRAGELGIWAFVLFAVVHWLCDLIWLGALAWASYKGSTLLGERSLRIVLLICSAALIVFGLIFIYDGGNTLVKLVRARSN